MHTEYRGDGNPVANAVLLSLEANQNVASQQTQSVGGSQGQNEIIGNVATTENSNGLMSVFSRLNWPFYPDVSAFIHDTEC